MRPVIALLTHARCFLPLVHVKYLWPKWRARYPDALLLIVHHNSVVGRHQFSSGRGIRDRSIQVNRVNDVLSKHALFTAPDSGVTVFSHTTEYVPYPILPSVAAAYHRAASYDATHLLVIEDDALVIEEAPFSDGEWDLGRFELNDLPVVAHYVARRNVIDHMRKRMPINDDMTFDRKYWDLVWKPWQADGVERCAIGLSTKWNKYSYHLNNVSNRYHFIGDTADKWHSVMHQPRVQQVHWARLWSMIDRLGPIELSQEDQQVLGVTDAEQALFADGISG